MRMDSITQVYHIVYSYLTNRGVPISKITITHVRSDRQPISVRFVHMTFYYELIKATPLIFLFQALLLLSSIKLRQI